MTVVDLSAVSAPSGGSLTLSGYVAKPATPGPWPGVLVIHEAFGINDVTRRQADRLAAAGYLTLAPDLFGAGGARRCLVSTFKALNAGTGRPFRDIEAGRTWLLEQSDCTGKVGVIGFCMGGGFALATATTGWDVAAPNYGVLPKDLDSALLGACPMVASYGGKDRTLKGAAARLEVGLTRAGVEHDVKEYPNASHSFLNDAPVGPRVLQPLFKVAGMGPEPDSAADAWGRIERFFAQHLNGH